MSSKVSEYELLLSEYCSRERIVTLLRQYRPYLEMVPSLRRPQDSVITIPLPIVKIRHFRSEESLASTNTLIVQLPCDLAILMCDPEWKVKLGVEILIFIYHGEEEFSQLLGRWRKTQIYLEKEYEWLMPFGEEHIFSDKAERILPLFIVFQHTPEHIKKGLINAGLPCLIQQPTEMNEGKVEIVADK